MIIGTEGKERERTAEDLNQEMSLDSNTDPDTIGIARQIFPEGFEEHEEPIGTSLSDILRQAVNETDGADRTSGRSHNCGSNRESSNRKKKLISENVIEREFVKAVHVAGGIAYKFALPEVQGMPDRLALFPSGISIFVEFLTPEKILNPMWTLRRRQLEYLGYPVICIDHLEQIIPAIKAILTWTPGESFPEKDGMKGTRHRNMQTDESPGLFAILGIRRERSGHSETGYCAASACSLSAASDSENGRHDDPGKEEGTGEKERKEADQHRL